jgi:hypothetical protein
MKLGKIAYGPAQKNLIMMQDYIYNIHGTILI